MKFMLILICIVMVLFAGFTFSECAKTKKEMKELKKQEEKNAEKYKETLENINAVTSGNFDASFDAGVDVLHNLAEKRK